MKHLLITGLVALLGSVQPALAQYDRYDRDDRYDRQDRSGRYDQDAYDRYGNPRYDRRYETRYRGTYSSRYSQPIVWEGAAYYPPRSRNFAWEQSKDLDRRDGMSEIELWADARATAAWLEVVDGVVQFSRGEVIMRDGTRVPVYMRGLTRGRGFYPLADFRGWADVSRVRLLVRSVTPGARVGLHLME